MFSEANELAGQATAAAEDAVEDASKKAEGKIDDAAKYAQDKISGFASGEFLFLLNSNFMNIEK